MAAPIYGVLAAIAPKLMKIVDEAVSDKDAQNRLRERFAEELFKANSETAQAASKVVMTEAKGENFLQRNWRPALMVWFAVLIGAYWFGFVPVNMPVEVVDKLFTLVQIGVGGYVVGRSGEKIAEKIGPYLSGRDSR